MCYLDPASSAAISHAHDLMIRGMREEDATPRAKVARVMLQRLLDDDRRWPLPRNRMSRVSRWLVLGKREQPGMMSAESAREVQPPHRSLGVPFCLPFDRRDEGGICRIIGNHCDSIMPKGLLPRPSDDAGPRSTIRGDGSRKHTVAAGSGDEHHGSPLACSITTARTNINAIFCNIPIVDPGPKRPDAVEDKAPCRDFREYGGTWPEGYI